MEHRYTAEEWIAIVNGICRWAMALRRYYNRTECECCGVAYHPRDGEPPDEEHDCPRYAYEGDDPDTGCYCGHAGMREMYQCWDYEANDWHADEWPW